MKHTYIFTSSPTLSDDDLSGLVRHGKRLRAPLRDTGLLSGISAVQFFTDANTMHEIAYAAGFSGEKLRTELPAAKERGNEAVRRAQKRLVKLKKVQLAQQGVPATHADTIRLDWLERTKSLLNFHEMEAHVCYNQNSREHYYGADARDVIDHAMKQTKIVLEPKAKIGRAHV